MVRALPLLVDILLVKNGFVLHDVGINFSKLLHIFLVDLSHHFVKLRVVLVLELVMARGVLFLMVEFRLCGLMLFLFSERVGFI